MPRLLLVGLTRHVLRKSRTVMTSPIGRWTWPKRWQDRIFPSFSMRQRPTSNGRSATGTRPTSWTRRRASRRDQERDGAIERAVRVRLDAGRARRPPPRADQPLSRPEPAPDDVRPRRGHARGRRGRRDRAQLGRDPGRHVPLAAPAASTWRRRVGGPADAPADRDRRAVPERAVRDPEPGDCDPGPQVAAARVRAREARGGAAQAPGRARRRPAGATRSGATSSTPTRWSRTCGPGYETSNTGAVLDGGLDVFMQAELERLATGRPPSADGDADDSRRRSGAGAPAGDAAGGIRYRPVTADDLATAGDLAGLIEDYRPPAQPAVDARGPGAAPAAASSPARDRPGRGSGSRAGPAATVGRRSRSASVARRAVVPGDAVRPPRDPGPRHRPGAAGPAQAGPRATRRAGVPARRRARLRDPHLGHVHRRGAADLERPVRPARDGAAHPDLAAVRRGAPLVGRAAAARRVESVAVRGGRRTGPTARGASRRSSTSSTGRSSASPTRSTTRTSAATAGSGSWSASAATGRRSGTPTGRASGGWGRCWPSTRRSTRADRDGRPRGAGARAGRAVGPGHRGRGDARRCSTRDSGSTASRGSSAGRAPTTPSTATCRSRWRSSDAGHRCRHGPHRC